MAALVPTSQAAQEQAYRSSSCIHQADLYLATGYLLDSLLHHTLTHIDRVIRALVNYKRQANFTREVKDLGSWIQRAVGLLVS
jgi:hypothetical protein